MVETHLKLVDAPTINAVLAQRQFTYAGYGNSGPIPEPSVWLNQLWRTGGSRNYGGISDPKLDDLADKQGAIFDIQQRKAIVREIVLHMMENSPSVAWGLQDALNFVHPKVRGFAPEGFLNGRQYQWLWFNS